MLSTFKHRRLIVLGDIGLDKYCEGVVERISPEAPVPVLNTKKRYVRLGMAANVANNIVALGGFPLLISVVGADHSGQDIVEELSRNHIDPIHLHVDPTRPTTTKERILTTRQQIVRIDDEVTENISNEMCQEVVHTLMQMEQVDGIIIQDHAKGVITRALIEKALQLLVPIFVDPNLHHSLEMYRGCYLITPNAKEAEHLTGVKLKTDKDIETALRLLEMEVKHAIITLGERGIAYLDTNDLVIAPAQAKEVYDVSGAGDTVVSVMALGLTSGFSFSQTIELANKAAGLACGKRVTATVSLQELAAEMN